MKLYDVSSQYKNLTPKFDSLKFPGNKYDEKVFLDWVNRISNIVRNHPPHGLAIEEFLDLHLDRCAFRAQVVPDWITSTPGLATAEVSDAVSISRGAPSQHSAPLGHHSISLGSADSSVVNATEEDYLPDDQRKEFNEVMKLLGSSVDAEAKAKVAAYFDKLSPQKSQRRESAPAEKPWLNGVGGSLKDFTPEMVALDQMLYVTLSNILMGTDIYHVISPLGIGPTARYTYAMIALYRHHGASASSRRIKAMDAVDALAYHGDPKRWKLDLVNAAREVYDSRVTIEHFIMAAALKSLNDKGLSTVQMMMVNDINDEDTMTNCNFDMLSSKYMVSLETMNAGKKSGRTSSVERVKCEYCKKLGHTEDVCRKKKRDQAEGKPGKGPVCNKCHKEGHIRKNCPQNKPSPTNQVAEGDEASSDDEEEAQVNMILDMIRSGHGRKKNKATGSVRQARTNAVRTAVDGGARIQPKITPVPRQRAGRIERFDAAEAFLHGDPYEDRNDGYGFKHGRKFSSDEDGDGPHDAAKEPPDPLLHNMALYPPEPVQLSDRYCMVLMAKPKLKGKARTVLKAVKAMQQMYANDEGLALSLLDGIGCSALGLRAAGLFKKARITKFASVEKDEDVRRVGAAVHQDTPGYTQGFMGVHDIDDITEEMIAAIPEGVLRVVFASPMCNDFSKLRLLPDRKDYRGPKRRPGEDPRAGLDGKYGRTFRTVIKIIQWVLKYHPHALYFVENVEFKAMVAHWKEVCDALGEPLIVDHEDHSTTKRRRAYWHNFEIPDDWHGGQGPIDPDTCMNPGRRVERYPVRGRMSVHPIGASWKGRVDAPTADSNKALKVIDERFEELQDLRPEEGEELHGLPRGSTEGEGITAMLRLRCIGGGFDTHVTNRLIAAMVRPLLESRVALALQHIEDTADDAEKQKARVLYECSVNNPKLYEETLRRCDPEDRFMVAVRTQHGHNIHSAREGIRKGSVIDSGAARHVTPLTVIDDAENRTQLLSFTGERTWSNGTGYVPLSIQDCDTEGVAPIDITGADHYDGDVSLLSLCKLLRDGWKFELELGSPYAFTPQGQKLLLDISDDTLVLPHEVREGKEAERLPVIGKVARTATEANATFFHRLMNHSNQQRVFLSLGVTKGWVQPSKPLVEVHCKACAIGKARAKGLRQTYVRGVCSCTRAESDGSTGGALYALDDVELTSQHAIHQSLLDAAPARVYMATPAGTDEPGLSDEDSDDEGHEHEEDDDFEYTAEVAGRELIQKPPRLDIPGLRPFEIMFVDEKDYDEIQRGGAKSALLMVDARTDWWDKEDQATKKDMGVSFRKIVVRNGIHKLDYQCTVYCDGDGAMNHLKREAIKMGINYVPIPPYSQSLNKAERVVDLAFAAARTYIVETGLPPQFTATALAYVCHMHVRMATNALRDHLTPLEMVKGYMPNIGEMMPFGTTAHVTLPKEKRSRMRSQGRGYERAETGIFIGYQTQMVSTPKILLPENRVIHSRNVTYTLVGETVAPEGAPQASEREAAADRILHEELARGIDMPQSPTKDLRSDPLDDQSLSKQAIATDARGDHLPELSQSPRMASPEPYDDGSPHAEDNPVFEDTNPATPEGAVPREGAKPKRNTGLNGRFWDQSQIDGPRNRHPVSNPHEPQSHGMESGEQKFELEHERETHHKNPRVNFILSVQRIMALEHEVDVFDAKLEAARKRLNAHSPEGDVQGHLAIAAYFASEAQKDISWKQYLGGEKRQEAIEAHNKEITSLCETILTPLKPDDPLWETAVKEATQSRILLDRKRSGLLKARLVKRGFLENRAIADGEDFDYYASVVKLHAVRTLLMSRRNLPNRVTKVRDVSVAFLQSNKFEDGKVKFLWYRNPITGCKEYFSQDGPIYGEASAPALWNRTISPWLEEQGFVQGDNETSVYYHPERQIVICLYVDDVCCDGPEDDVDWILDRLAKRFNCKETENLLPNTALDYLGIGVYRDEVNVWMSMEAYIVNACKVIGVTAEGKTLSAPISDPIDTDSPELPRGQVKAFLTATGMLGWLAQTVRCDTSYAYSRIAQHCAHPTESAMKAVRRCFKYLLQTKHLALCGQYDPPERVLTGTLAEADEDRNPFRFYSDSDHAGNAEIQNKRRSQNGFLGTLHGAPVIWSSKASSVAFASPNIGEAHADMSSGAAEVYALGNAVTDTLAFSYAVEEMGLEFEFPFIMEVDNEAAKIFSEGNGGRTKMKHIDCRQEWVKTLRDKKVVKCVHLDTKHNLADLFTKILPGQRFIELRDQCLKTLILPEPGN